MRKGGVRWAGSAAASASSARSVTAASGPAGAARRTPAAQADDRALGQRAARRVEDPLLEMVQLLLEPRGLERPGLDFATQALEIGRGAGERGEQGIESGLRGGAHRLAHPPRQLAEVARHP